jgi:hypothetical protein
MKKKAHQGQLAGGSRVVAATYQISHAPGGERFSCIESY